VPSGLLAVGGYVPPTIVDNVVVADWAGVAPEWVEERTGILERRYAPRDEATSDLAVRAAAPLLADERARQAVDAW